MLEKNIVQSRNILTNCLYNERNRVLLTSLGKSWSLWWRHPSFQQFLEGLPNENIVDIMISYQGTWVIHLAPFFKTTSIAIRISRSIEFLITLGKRSLHLQKTSLCWIINNRWCMIHFNWMTTNDSTLAPWQLIRSFPRVIY